MKRLKLAAFLLACAPVAALADGPTQADTTLAQGLFDEGVQLVRDGDPAAACVKFAESQRLAPAGGTILNLGVCLEKQQKYASAYLAYQEALSTAIKDGHKEREARARDRIAAITPLISRIVIRVDAGVQRLEGLDVRFDTATVREAAWGAPAPVDPGVHVVTATATGKKETRISIDVGKPGETYTVRIAELADAPKPAPVIVVPKTQSDFKKPLGIAALGVGAASLVAGGIFVAAAVGNHSASNANCIGGCSMHGVALEEDADRWAWAANIAIGTAVVLGVTGVLLLVTSHPPRVASNVSIDF